jgi:hypothetical protein
LYEDRMVVASSTVDYGESGSLGCNQLGGLVECARQNGA